MVQYTEYPKNRPVNNTIEPPVSDRPECEEVAAYEYRTSEYLLFEGKLPEYCQPVLRRRRLERKTSLRPRSKSCVHAASKRLSTHARVQPTIHSNFRYVSLRVVSKGSSYVIHTANTHQTMTSASDHLQEVLTSVTPKSCRCRLREERWSTMRVQNIVLCRERFCCFEWVVAFLGGGRSLTRSGRSWRKKYGAV